MKEYQLRPPGQQSPPPTKLTDDSPMPFGKWRGTPMKEIPAQYLFWLWTNGKEQDMRCPVAAYIRENIRALAGEYTDGIW